MAAIISRTEIIDDKLSATDGFEIAEAFGTQSENKTKYEDYEFPMQIPCIAKVQVKDKSLMKELIKSDHKYELTKIECTAVLTLHGEIFIPTAILNSVFGWCHPYLCNIENNSPQCIITLRSIFHVFSPGLLILWSPCVMLIDRCPDNTGRPNKSARRTAVQTQTRGTRTCDVRVSVMLIYSCPESG
jgi:hypothetical protein